MEKRSDSKKKCVGVKLPVISEFKPYKNYSRYHLARNVSITKSRKRIVTKSGQCNIGTRSIEAGRLKYFQDIFTTLLDMKWRLVLLIFSMSFFLSWLGFGFLFWLIALVHGDLDEQHLPPNQGKTECIELWLKWVTSGSDYSLWHCSRSRTNQRKILMERESGPINGVLGTKVKCDRI